jgi:hypothetical protein
VGTKTVYVGRAVCIAKVLGVYVPSESLVGPLIGDSVARGTGSKPGPGWRPYPAVGSDVGVDVEPGEGNSSDGIGEGDKNGSMEGSGLSMVES